MTDLLAKLDALAVSYAGIPPDGDYHCFVIRKVDWQDIRTELLAARAVCEAVIADAQLCPACDHDVSGHDCICTRPNETIPALAAYRAARTAGGG